jgi:ATP-binding cassette subfamily B protein
MLLDRVKKHLKWIEKYFKRVEKHIKQTEKHFKEIKWLYTYIRLFSSRLFIIVILGALLSLSGVYFALVSRKLMDTATGFEEGSLIFYGILMGLMLLFQTMLQAGLSVFDSKVAEDMNNFVRSNLLYSLINSKWLDYSKIHSEDMVTRMTSDISIITKGITSTIPGIIFLFVRLISAFALLYYFDPMLALLGILVGPLFLLLSKLFSPKLRRLHIETQQAESNVRRTMKEILGNILVVKAFNRENSSREQINYLQNIHRSWVVKRSFIGTGSSVLMSAGFGMGYLLALLWGAWRLSEGMITFGTLTAFLQLIGQIQGPFLGLAHSLPGIISTLGSAGRLMELERLPKEEGSYTYEIGTETYETDTTDAKEEKDINLENTSLQDTFQQNAALQDEYLKNTSMGGTSFHSKAPVSFKVISPLKSTTRSPKGTTIQ